MNDQVLIDFKIRIDADEFAAIPMSEMTEAMHRRYQKTGFLVLCATPVPMSFSGSVDSYSYSWGFFSTRWFYAETLPEAFQLGLSWQAQYIKEKYQAGVA